MELGYKTSTDADSIVILGHSFTDFSINSNWHIGLYEKCLQTSTNKKLFDLLMLDHPDRSKLQFLEMKIGGKQEYSLHVLICVQENDPYPSWYRSTFIKEVAMKALTELPEDSSTRIRNSEVFLRNATKTEELHIFIQDWVQYARALDVALKMMCKYKYWVYRWSHGMVLPLPHVRHFLSCLIRDYSHLELIQIHVAKDYAPCNKDSRMVFDAAKAKKFFPKLKIGHPRFETVNGSAYGSIKVDRNRSTYFQTYYPSIHATSRDSNQPSAMVHVLLPYVPNAINDFRMKSSLRECENLYFKEIDTLESPVKLAVIRAEVVVTLLKEDFLDEKLIMPKCVKNSDEIFKLIEKWLSVKVGWNTYLEDQVNPHVKALKALVNQRRTPTRQEFERAYDLQLILKYFLSGTAFYTDYKRLEKLRFGKYNENDTCDKMVHRSEIPVLPLNEKTFQYTWKMAYLGFQDHVKFLVKIVNNLPETLLEKIDDILNHFFHLLARISTTYPCIANKAHLKDAPSELYRDRSIWKLSTTKGLSPKSQTFAGVLASKLLKTSTAVLSYLDAHLHYTRYSQVEITQYIKSRGIVLFQSRLFDVNYAEDHWIEIIPSKKKSSDYFGTLAKDTIAGYNKKIQNLKHSNRYVLKEPVKPETPKSTRPESTQPVSMPRNLLNSTENNDAYLINMYLNDSRQSPPPDYTSKKQKLSNDPLQNRKKSTPATSTAAKFPQVTTLGETVPKARSTDSEEAVSRTGASLQRPLPLEAVMKIIEQSMRSSDASSSINLQSTTKAAEKFVLKPKPMRKIPKNSDLLASKFSKIPQTLSIPQTSAPLPAQPSTSSTTKLSWPTKQQIETVEYTDVNPNAKIKSRQYPFADYPSKKLKLLNDPLQNQENLTPATSAAATLPQVAPLGETVLKACSTDSEGAVSRTAAPLHSPLSLEAVMKVNEQSMRLPEASSSANSQATTMAEKIFSKTKPTQEIPRNSPFSDNKLSRIPPTLSISQTPAKLPVLTTASLPARLPDKSWKTGQEKEMIDYIDAHPHANIKTPEAWAEFLEQRTNFGRTPEALRQHVSKLTKKKIKSAHPEWNEAKVASFYRKICK